ncbi:MAG TPA: N-acetyl-gamma-glutamyl-phosphate reductase [Methylomirabilota bacterium]|jgi:N-acetyl-gamma-glutamyl-phosphate reductase|nr:N-acetyl-gamma-glutamyl-phosphate reductase [Methylomirabilota bacterium]
MGVRVGIVGVSGYGGSELLRLCVGHPAFEVVYASGETTAGQRLAQQFPALAGHPTGNLVIQPFVPEELHGVDLLFASLPTGKSREPLARVPRDVKVLDVGGDHRWVDGWTYGLTELPGARPAIAASARVANPGCYPAAALLALAPLVAAGLIELDAVVVDAKTGVSGAGRGGGASGFGYAETNEDVVAYGLGGHPHAPEMREALGRLAGRAVTLAFTPHLVPMTRGILATCYARPRGPVAVSRLEEAARAMYRDEPFVRLAPVQGGRSARTKWATGSNLAFVSYAVNAETGLVVALAAIDNLGKGAAGQAVQNANLMTGLPETSGLSGLPLWP